MSPKKTKKQKKSVNKFDKYLLLSWRKLWIIIVLAFISIILHNLIYGLGIYFGGEEFWGAGGDEPFFFILTMVIILYFLITMIYTLVRRIIDKTIFKKEFILRAIISIIIGVLISYLIIEFTFINPPLFYFLAVIFSFIAYYIIKFINF